MRIQPRGILFLVTALVWLAGTPADGQVATPATENATRSGTVARLLHIERKLLPPGITTGPAQHASIADYYVEANAKLGARFEEARQAFADSQERPFHAMTLVAGPAGIGKTFIKRHVYGDIPADKIWKFDIREMFEEMEQQGFAEVRPDLQLGDRVLNRMLALTPQGRKVFRRCLASQSAEFVVIDSLDEIHPDDYSFVLTQLESFALENDRRFIHLVVFGRPLAFRDYWQHRTENDRHPGLKFYLLHKPSFRTTGDMTVSNWNYDCWKHGLKRRPVGRIATNFVRGLPELVQSGLRNSG